MFVILQVRESTCLPIHRCAFLPKHSRNRPVFLVGFPNANHIARGVVIAPSATSQMMSAMAEASSMIISTWSACRPANASEFVSDQGIASIPHVALCETW